jgi:peptidase E
MEKQVTTSVELSQDQQDMLRSLLDSEVILIGGGEVAGCFN